MNESNPISDLIKGFKDRAGNIFVTIFIVSFISRYKQELYELANTSLLNNHEMKINNLTVWDEMLLLNIVVLTALYALSVFLGRAYVAGKELIIRKSDAFFSKFIPISTEDKKILENQIESLNNENTNQKKYILEQKIKFNYLLASNYAYFNKNLNKDSLKILEVNPNSPLFLYNEELNCVIDKTVYKQLLVDETLYFCLYKSSLNVSICVPITIKNSGLLWEGKSVNRINLGNLAMINSDSNLHKMIYGQPQYYNINNIWVNNKPEKPYFKLIKEANEDIILEYRAN